MNIFQGKLTKDDEWTLEYELDTVQAGLLTFTMHKRDEEDANELFSVYVRAALGRTSEDMRAAAERIAEAFHEKPHPFNLKWNIHELHPDRTLEILQERLEWLMNP